jgi:hypothetical protein
MASAAVQIDEESLIRGFVEQIDLPPGVKLSRVEQYVDWTGDEALRIFFTVSTRYPLTKKRVNALSDMKNTLQEKVFEAKVIKFPYVSFLETK